MKAKSKKGFFNPPANKIKKPCPICNGLKSGFDYLYIKHLEQKLSCLEDENMRLKEQIDRVRNYAGLEGHPKRIDYLRRLTQ